jgi:radical SAM protein with 4Fe4S-binding SPASM domain
MTTAEILGFVNQLAPYRPRIYFGGGEPFIREDFLTILGHVKSFDLPVSLATNGTLLDQERIQKVVALGIDKMNFSIDGYEELHDELRGEGSFSKVTSNIKNIMECRKEKNIKKPFITVNITINPLVVGHLQDTIHSVRTAIGDEVDFYRIHHLWFITLTELQVHKAAIQKYLNREASGAKAHFIPFSQEIDSRALANEISQIKNWERIKYFPNLRDKEIMQFYSGSCRIKKRCMAPFRAAIVKPNGDVKFCPDEWIDDYILGNIREDRFENIWNNKQARRFRSIIFWKKSFPGCKRCSWMHCI